MFVKLNGFCVFRLHQHHYHCHRQCQKQMLPNKVTLKANGFDVIQFSALLLRLKYFASFSFSGQMEYLHIAPSHLSFNSVNFMQNRKSSQYITMFVQCKYEKFVKIFRYY